MFNSSFWHKRNLFYEPGEDLELAKWSINPLLIFEVPDRKSVV